MAFPFSVLLNIPLFTANFHELLVQYKAKEQTRIIQFGRIWAVVFGSTILTGLSAIGILLWAFVSALWKNYCTYALVLAVETLRVNAIQLPHAFG